jgi:hypothetical protein
MSDLRAIVYVSTATQLMSVSQLESLLVEARDLNRKSAITGVLLYNDGNFIQYFEGSVEAVRITYERIQSSRSHKGIIELMNERIAHRNFADWQMGFAQPTQSELLALSTARWQCMESEGHGSMGKSPGLSLLQGFWKRARR